MFLFLLLAFIRGNGVAELARWEFLLTKVQKLADHNGNKNPQAQE